MPVCKHFSLVAILLLFSCINSSDKGEIRENRGKAISNLSVENDLRVRYQRALIEKNDSLRNKLLLNISYDALHAGDDELFLKANKQAEKLSIRLADTSRLAGVYWDLGKYYYRLPKKDSAYFYYDRAQKLYYGLEDHISAGRLLLNLAIIQKDIKDYTGSEVTTTNAITLLSPYQDYFSLYVAYNNMGIVFNELKEYNRALYYQSKALNALRKTNNKDRLPSLYNNMGVVYDNKKEYQTAVRYFNRALRVENDLSATNPKIYAMILDNRAYARLHLGQTDQVYKELNKALMIRESLHPQTGIGVSHLHLAEYFLMSQDTTRAICQALKAEQYARENRNARDLLKATKFLTTQVDYKPLYYAQHYIQLDDSLSSRERTVRNKFARIRMETDEYIDKTENLHRRIIRLSIIAGGVFLVFVLLYIIKTQRSRTKLLEQKQKANRAIYDLKLTQRKHFERGREEEKHRISRELHDGILAELFGIRLSLGSLNNRDDSEGRRRRLEHLRDLQEVARKIRRISHALGKDSVVAVDFNTLLEELIHKEPKAVDLHLRVSKDIDWNKIDDTVKINIYRILQEALSNIFKHAEATTAKIEINRIKKILILRIGDNGKGFAHTRKKSGMGLKNIKTRAQSIRGKLRIQSGGHGTQLRVVIDLRRGITK